MWNILATPEFESKKEMMVHFAVCCTSLGGVLPIIDPTPYPSHTTWILLKILETEP